MKVLVLIADGFEEIEAITSVDLLRRAKIDVNLVSITGKRDLTGSHNVGLVADSLIEDIKAEEYEALVLPGGLPNAYTLRDDERVISLVEDFYNKGKIVGAICAAPCVLQKAGILEGKNATSYPSFLDENRVNYIKKKVVVDSNIVTGNGVGGAIEFSLELIRQLGLEKEANSIKEGILYSWPS